MASKTIKQVGEEDRVIPLQGETRTRAPQSESVKWLSSMTERMAKGDLNAMSAVYKHFFNKLFRYGLVISPSGSLVEDTIQDVFVWLMEHPKQTARIRDLEIYLFQSLKRNLREKIKKQGRRLRIIDHYFHENEATQYTSPVENRLIAEESVESDRHWLDRQLQLLPTHLKEVIYLRFYEGLSYQEIAEITSTSNQVVRNYVSRALKQIRSNR